jgi:hypothetical protein
MKRPARPAAAALGLAALAVTAACGSQAPAPRGTSPAPWAPPAGAQFLTTSLATAGGTWAVAVMGGSAAAHNNFWQLFARPAASTTWKLVTPPGTADNGGLVLADDGGGRSLVAGFRPSQGLTYTPLTVTRDGGQKWSSTAPLDAALADVPDGLAAAPGTGGLLALLTNGTAKRAAPGSPTWTTLASRRSLAATAPGRACGLSKLTAAAFSPSGAPLLAGGCTHRGTAGIFAYAGGAWRAAGPPIPGTLAGRPITVLRLTSTARGMIALLTAGTGAATSLLAAWSAGDSQHWTLSPPVRLNGAHLTSASFGPGGTAAIMLNAGHGETIAGPARSWRPLPALPAATATLAAGPAGGLDALAVHHTVLTVWRLAPGSAAWARTQTINVPIQFGSSS